MKREKTPYLTRLALAIALSLSLVGGDITAAGEAEPFASFEELRSDVQDQVADDGRLGLQTIPGLESIGALQDLEIWPASLALDPEVPRLSVSGPITVGDRTTEARFEGRQTQDGSLRLSMEFEYLSLAEVTGLMERQTGQYLPADAPVRSDLELSKLKVVLQPGADGFTVKGTTTVAGLTLDVLAAITRQDGGENGDLSEMIVGFRATDLNLREFGGSLAGTSLDLQLPEVIFAIRQPFHTARLAPVALSELDPVAEEYFRKAVGQDEDVELHFAAGFNLFASIDVALLPPAVVDAIGMNLNDRILLQGSIGLDLQKFVDEGTLEVDSMRLAVDAGSEAPRRYELITDLSTDGERVSTAAAQVFSAPQARWEPVSPIAKLVAAVGFHYDPEEDILYSKPDAWQRSFGYAWLYDVMAPPAISAIIDCEPIYFSHGGKDWMVELWKGQYGLETGGEIGVYNRRTSPADAAKYRVLDKITGKFFDAVDDDELWDMSFVLRKGDKRILSRGPEKHWWLTGFKWGELSDPEELTMDVTIDFDQDSDLRDAFVDGLSRTGYDDIEVDGGTVRFEFHTPFTEQPGTRTEWQSEVQQNNRTLVELYKLLDLESHDPNLIRIEQFAGVEKQEAVRLLTEHFEAVARGWVERIAEALYGQIATLILERLDERREQIMQDLRDLRDRQETRRAIALAEFQHALDLLREPAHASMEFYERRHNEAVTERDHAYRMWQAARPIHKPAWFASYVYWKGIANSRLVAYQGASRVYNADIETWIANNPALSVLRQARESAWQALEQANAALDEANRIFSEASRSVTVHGATFETGPGVFEDGGSVSMALDIEIGAQRHLVHVNPDLTDIDTIVEETVDNFVARFQT